MTKAKRKDYPPALKSKRITISNTSRINRFFHYKLLLHLAIIILVSCLIAVSANALENTALENTHKQNKQNLSSNLELKGTAFTGSSKPIAIIKLLNSQRIAMYELGDEVDGVVILHIERGKVILMKDREEYTLGLPEGPVIQPVSKKMNLMNLVFNKRRAIKDTVKEIGVKSEDTIKSIKRLSPRHAGADFFSLQGAKG